MNKPTRKGKKLKIAIYALMYNMSIKSVYTATGVSKRRIKKWWKSRYGSYTGLSI